MKHDIERRFAPGEEQKSGPGAIIGTCWTCGKSGVGASGDCAGPPSTHAVASNWAATPGVGEDILADIAKAAKMIGEQQWPPPPESRPWCCKDAIVPGAKYVHIEGSPHPLFVCEKHLAELMNLAAK